jgi:hypothetical protein
MAKTPRQHETSGSDLVHHARPERTFVLADHWAWTDAAVVVLGVVLALVALATLFGAGGAGPWAVVVALWGLIVTAVALAPPRRGRVERVVETH